MKVILFILVTLVVLSALCSATGVNVLGNWNAGNVHGVVNRLVAGVTMIYCGSTAYLCFKRKLIGWWLVTVLWVGALVGVLINAVWTAYHIGLPPLGLVLGGLGELVKIGIGAAVLWRVWLPLRKDFTPRRIG
ncbi:MAG TPA: hypothetical protein PLU52_00120 [Opitutaceae bacterium]|nr:hypothetical protein [Opitutaceae bacterium]